MQPTGVLQVGRQRRTNRAAMQLAQVAERQIRPDLDRVLLLNGQRLRVYRQIMQMAVQSGANLLQPGQVN